MTTTSGTLLGYVRTSTAAQNDALQRDALVAAGVDESHIYADVISGSTRAAVDRPRFAALSAYAREGDTLVVWRIDRLGRSLIDVLATVEDLQARGIRVRSIQDGIDPSTTSGALMLGILSTLAEYERSLIRERVTAGLAAAKARNVRLGRPATTLDQTAGRVRAAKLAQADGMSGAEAAASVGWSRATYYRHLARHAAAAGVTV